MMKVKGFALPDGEEHLAKFLREGPEFAGGPTYQLHKLMMCMPHIKNFRRAVDVGAHCGLWTRPLAQMFRWVTAFEPIVEHQRCFRLNLDDKMFTGDPDSFVELWPVALGAHQGKVSLHTGEGSSGDTYVQEGGEHRDVVMSTLDSYVLRDVDFVKIDCEGYESYVLQGGEETIRKQKPFVIVEQKPGKGQQFGIGDHAALDILRKWGATQVFQYSGDFGFKWQ